MEYQFILIPLGISLLTQLVVKQLIELIRGKFSWKNLISYGGMPSAHSALVVSLATIIGLQEGLNSSSFAVSLFLAVIVITDAIGFRGYLTEHSKAINKLIIDLPDELEYKYKTLNERISHTVNQVLAGALTGFILTYLTFIIL
jgi:uncharacterized protein